MRITQAVKQLKLVEFSRGLSALCIIAIILTTVWQADIWTGAKGVVAIMQVKKKIEVQTHSNTEQEEKNRQIYREIASLKQSHEVVETKAREDLGMIKKGEIYYQIGHAKALQ